MHFSDASQMRAVRAWAHKWRVQETITSGDRAHRRAACVKLQANARRMVVCRRFQRERVQALWREQAATDYARRYVHASLSCASVRME